ncbi:MAG: MBL fold metallo-hydrolase [Candidatus Odinarchaeia archaeon]
MKLKIIYDNTAVDGFTPSHGFSCLFELEDGYFLFDTGWNGEILLDNLRRFNIDLKKIKYLFLSHFHWDHIGGVAQILKYAKPQVFLLKSFSNNFKKEVLKITKITEITRSEMILPGIFTTGELKESSNKIPEQSLVVKTDENTLLITGCAHPGLENIIDAAMKIDKITFVLGGFHGFKNFEVLDKIPHIAPTHCTKYKEEIIKRYLKKAVRVGAGTTLTI